ncbi:MAG: hypothetical protein KGJ95_10470 [Candidatus Omnitrophica bacterium]|nr:hypothetical protein [Candidatus Omnitrophota bacterium]
MTTTTEAQKAFEEHMRQVLIGYKHSPLIEHAETIRQALRTANAQQRLVEAFGMFLNGMAYYSTFPDNAEDAKQLQKQATCCFLEARKHVDDETAQKCLDAAKVIYVAAHEKVQVTIDPAWCETTRQPKRECWCEKCLGGIPTKGDKP